MYFGCVYFRDELGFLNCDDICMCVVNKQFELLEPVTRMQRPVASVSSRLVPSVSRSMGTTRSRRSCVISHVNVGRVGTLSYNSFRWRSIRLFNSLPMHLRSISSCSVLRLKTQLDIFLGSVEDLPCLPGFNNSLASGDCRWWSPRDGLATN